MEKGQICYLIADNDIEPVEFIEILNSQQVHIKRLSNNNVEYWTGLCYICNTKEEAYKKLLDWLEYDKQEAEETIEDLEDELDVINEAIKKLKQKYEI